MKAHRSYTEEQLHYLKMLSRQYPTVREAGTEIINLQAILNLPKGCEHFISDVHGEHEAFIHMLKSASGTIKMKIDEHFENVLNEREREELAALVYNAEAEIARRRKNEKNFDDWCNVAIYRLITICKSVSTKYTRSRVRQRLPKYMEYSIDELLHADDEANRSHYYSEIINSIVECGVAEEFIIELTEAISRLAVDKLHIIGDIFDRGAHPDAIMDFLMDFHDVDFQWGNHDIVWMGAAAGNWACITNLLRMNISYNNFDMLEVGYGINLRPLATFAAEVYAEDPCEFFKPHILDHNKYDPVPEQLAAKMHKAIAICQFKIEGQRIKAHPEYNLNKRLLLDKIDLSKGTVEVEGVKWPLRDVNFPTLDPEDPYRLTEEEEEVMRSLAASFLNSEKLQTHIKFLYNHGALYTRINGNLLYHGCMPMNEDGTLKEVQVDGKKYKGKALYDILEHNVRRAFVSRDPKKREQGRNTLWYLWTAPNSPLYGRDKMTTFERYFLAEKETWTEVKNAYYRLIEKEETADRILQEFGLAGENVHIINGHVPVHQSAGESPVKCGGKVLIIDGGFCRAYHKETGIAGYTLIYNSYGLSLTAHEPFESTEKAIQEEKDIVSRQEAVRYNMKRQLVGDTDQGRQIRQRIRELKELIEAYRTAQLKELL